MNKLIFGLLFLFIIGFAGDFDCEHEFCDFNGTEGEWNCYYLGCEERPDFVVIEQVNETIFNVTDCSEQEIYNNIYEVWNRHEDGIDKRLNYSWSLSECQIENEFLEEKFDDLDDRTVDKNKFEVCEAQLKDTEEKVEGSGAQYLLVGIVFFVIGILAKIGFDRITDQKGGREDVHRKTGDVEIDTNALRQEEKRRREMDALEQRLKAEFAGGKKPSEKEEPETA